MKLKVNKISSVSYRFLFNSIILILNLKYSNGFGLQLANQATSQPANVSAASDQLEPAIQTGSTEPTPLQTETPQIVIPEYLAKRMKYFSRNSLDLDQFKHIDCHLRNIDFCFAGLIGSSAKVLPETDAELESRCDEYKLSTNCMLTYNERCLSFRAFSMVSPLLSMSSQLIPNQLAASNQIEVPLELISAPTKASNVSVLLSDFMSICEPSSRDPSQLANNKLIRSRLFELAKCINPKIPNLNPCINDLKVALQLFYEPRKLLPAKPSCCAISRFRHCAIEALDNICGLSSFDQLESTLVNSGPMSAIKSVDRFCKHAANFESQFCKDTLPPSGTKIPPARGSKASKLAKALDLISLTSSSSSSAATN